MGRCGRPGTFESAGNGVFGVTFSKGVLPSGALFFDGGTGRFGSDVFAGIGGTVCFTEGVSAGDEGHGFFIVHGHATECFADVAGRGDGVGITVGSFGVHIDQSHLYGSEWIFQIAITGIAFIAQPFFFRSPVDVFFGFPYIGASATESEGFESHGFEGAVTGQDHQIGPGEFASVFLFDGPQQESCLVEVGIIGPAVQGGEALGSVSGATATIGDAVGSGAVPGHADEEGAIVTIVGRPPVLRGGHQVYDVLFDGLQIECFELGGIVEIVAHRVGQAGVLAKDVQLKLIGPPVAVVGATASAFLEHTTGEGAFAFAVDVVGILRIAFHVV